MPRIQSFGDLAPGDQVVIWVRVSARSQSWRAQLIRLLHQVYRRGARVVAIRCHPVSGKILSNELRSAIESAKFWDATLLGYSLDRFIRHPDFSPSDPSTWRIPAPVLKRFLEMAKGVNVTTLL